MYILYFYYHEDVKRQIMQFWHFSLIFRGHQVNKITGFLLKSAFSSF